MDLKILVKVTTPLCSRENLQVVSRLSCCRSEGLTAGGSSPSTFITVRIHRSAAPETHKSPNPRKLVVSSLFIRFSRLQVLMFVFRDPRITTGDRRRCSSVRLMSSFTTKATEASLSLMKPTDLQILHPQRSRWRSSELSRVPVKNTSVLLCSWCYILSSTPSASAETPKQLFLQEETWRRISAKKRFKTTAEGPGSGPAGASEDVSLAGTWFCFVRLERYNNMELKMWGRPVGQLYTVIRTLNINQLKKMFLKKKT